MVIYANLQTLRMVDARFFATKKAQGKDEVRKGLRPITLRFRANAQKLILGSIGTPLTT